MKKPFVVLALSLGSLKKQMFKWPCDFRFLLRSVFRPFPQCFLAHLWLFSLCVNFFKIALRRIVERCHTCLNWPVFGVSSAPIKPPPFWLRIFSLLVGQVILPRLQVMWAPHFTELDDHGLSDLGTPVPGDYCNPELTGHLS